MLRDVSLEPNFDLDLLARRSEGLSGSDLKELCRNAAGAPVREHLKTMSRDPLEMDLKREVARPHASASSISDLVQVQLRSLVLEDFFALPDASRFTHIEDGLEPLD
jgi:SpoVK/Ycf46/Vps4 family AAA+-type ATPase